jgi:hypothetical protein
MNILHYLGNLNRDMRTFLFIAGWLGLMAAEMLKVYFIMPFPGSQRADTVDIAYWLHGNIWWLRLFFLAVLAWPAWQMLAGRSVRQRWWLFAALLAYAMVFILCHFRFPADRMFLQPRHLTFASASSNKVKQDKLVIGVEINGEAKAYPIQLIGYHHQVRDTVGGRPVMVTYCTVCRTGRVFSPVVQGRAEQFRLVGMDHFNAMFEDGTTKSWWRQATGEAVAGPRKGMVLEEIPSAQMSLSAWLRLHPGSLILQPDTLYREQYAELSDFDKGTIKSGLEKRDSLSWKDKSWVIGVVQGKEARAYDWNELIARQIIQDQLGGTPLLITLERDSTTFHVLDRRVNGTALRFERSGEPPQIRDTGTGSIWEMDGVCVDGSLKGSRLNALPAYQEFWHSWKTFHPWTTRQGDIE